MPPLAPASICPSRRQAIMTYLWDRTNKSFRDGNYREANDCDRFHRILRDLSDNEYDDLYEGCDGADS